MVKIYPIQEADARLAEAVARLVPQLSAVMPVPSEAALRQIVASPSTVLLGADVEGMLAGMLSLVWYDVPSGRHARIEDVVVDCDFRSRGIGKALVQAALEQARGIGADKVSLTSHTSREAAHALYRSAGFERYDTTVFCLRMKQ